MPLERRYAVLLAGIAVSALPLVLVDDLRLAAPLAAVLGLAWAPTMSCQYALVGRTAPAGSVTEAFTWSTSAFVGGSAVGAAIAGAVAESAGAGTAFALLGGERARGARPSPSTCGAASPSPEPTSSCRIRSRVCDDRDRSRAGAGARPEGAWMNWRYGDLIAASDANGREFRSPVFNENEVRAAAGLTMVLGAIAFVYAFFDKVYGPIQIVTTFFFVEFLIRVTLGLRYSPIGVVSRLLTRRYPPEWVSAKPKRFAWSIGVGMSFAMMIITNSGIRGLLPMSICLVCLALMWLESVLGLCVGCELTPSSSGAAGGRRTRRSRSARTARARSCRARSRRRRRGAIERSARLLTAG